MIEQHDLFFNLVIVLGSATIVAVAFHLLRLPPMVGFLVAGVLIGPNGLKLVRSIGEVETLAEIGAVLLLFTLGLEFSWKKVLSLKKLLINLGLVQVALTGLIVAWISHSNFGLDWQRSFFIGILVAMSSTAVVIKLLSDQRHTETPFGKASLGILVSQDLAVIMVLMVLPLMSETTTSGWNFLTLADLGTLGARIILVLALLIFGTRYFVPRFLDLVGTTRSREVFFFAVIFICATIALLMQKLGLSLSLGAFCAGVMVSESPYGRQTMADFTPLRDNFLGIFFVAIGMLLSLEFLSKHLGATLVLLGGVIFLKCVIIFTIMWMLGNAGTLAVSTGLILAQVGEFSFILADQGLKLGLLDENGRQQFLAVAIGSLALSPLLYRLALHVAYRFDHDQIVPQQLQNLALQLRETLVRQPMKMNIHEVDLAREENGPLSEHVILVGFGIAAQNLAGALKGLAIPYRILETNQSTVRKFLKKEPIVFGDATRPDILENLGIESARLLVITVTGAEIGASVVRTARRLNSTLPILIRTQYGRDLKSLNLDPNCRVVVAEYEGTLALLDEALKIYQVPTEGIDAFIQEAKSKLKQSQIT